MTLSPLSNRGSKLLMIASLGLNAFFAGMLVARGNMPPPPPHHRPSPAHLAEVLARTLPEADAVILRQGFADHMRQIERFDQEQESHIEELKSLLRQDPFDPAAFLAAMEKHRQRRDSFDALFQPAIADALSRMSPEGRRKLAEWRGPGPGPEPRRGPGPE